MEKVHLDGGYGYLDVMLKIDFTQFARDRVWFTWQCLNILHDADGNSSATWQSTLFWTNYFKWPFIYKHDWEIKEYKLETDNGGCQIYTEI